MFDRGMDDPDHPMGDAEDSSRISPVPTNLGGNSLASVHRSAVQRDGNSSSVSSRHSPTASGLTVFPNNPTTAEETSQQGAEGEVSLDSLVDSLPSVAESSSAPPLTQAQINRIKGDQAQAAFEKKKAERAAAKAEKERVERQAALKVSLPKPVQPASQSQTATQAVPAPRDPFPFRKIEPFKSTPCAIALDGIGPVVGHVKDNAGYKITVKVEGGKLGNPSLAISFTCNTKLDPKDSQVSQDPDETQTITLHFRPGLKSTSLPNKFVIEDYEDQYLSSVPRTDTTIWRPEVEKLLEPLGRRASFVRVFRFEYNDYELVQDPNAVKVWKQYKTLPVFTVMKKMLGTVPTVVTIWTLVDNPKDGQKVNFDAFKRACRQRLQPYFQYYSPDNTRKPVLNLEHAETIDSIGNGMYRKYAKDDQGNPTKVVAGYASHPPMTSWNTEDEFRIWHSITPIREYYHSKGLAVHKENQLLRAFLRRGHHFDSTRIANLQAEGNLSDFQERYFAYVRMPSRNSVESPPGEKLMVKLEWDNSTPHTEHISDKLNMWYGQIIRTDPQILKDTNTNFCIMLIKPPGAPPKRPHDKLALLDDSRLYQCHLTIDVSDDVTVSELKAIKDFLASNHPVIRRLREQVMSPHYIPYPPEEYVNMAEGPPCDDPMEKVTREDLYDHYIARAERSNDNISQVAVIRAAKHTPPLVVTAGPPGTGKSKTIADFFWSLVAVEHIVVIFANNNDSLDETLNKTLAQRPKEFIGFTIIRSETTSVADRQMRQQGLEWASKYMELKPEQVNQLEDPQEKWTDLPAYQLAMERITDEDSDEQWEAFEKEAALYKQTFEAYQEAEGQKRYGTGVVTEATMGWHIWKHCQQTRADAQKAYDKDVAEAQKKYKNDAPALANFTRHLKLVESRDESRHYIGYRKYYVSVGGQVGRGFRTVYDAHRIKIENIIYAKARGIFVTASNSVDVASRKDEAGNKIVNPTVLIAEESGTLTTAALAVPLTAFTTWLALYMFGGHEQPFATLLARQLNEMRETAKISVLENIIKKGYPYHLLNQQYRMNPELSKFPSVFFYEGKLKDHTSTHVDNVNRQAGRAVSKLYGIDGPNGDGSCFFFVNLPLSVSRLEEGGTTLINYAHVDAIKEQVTHALLHGVRPEDITVLVWYQGQRGLVNREVRMIVLPDGTVVKQPIGEVSTVDAYLGKENSYLIVDFVVGSETLNPYMVEVEPDEVSDLQHTVSPGGSRKFGRITSHVKNGSRIKVALTRGKDVVICIGQAAIMLHTTTIKERGQEEKSALAALVREALSRRVMYDHQGFRDSHPDAIQERLLIPAAQLKREERENLRMKFNYVTQTARKWTSSRRK